MYIRHSPGCQKILKSNTKTAHLAALTILTGPNMRVHVDLFGPLKLSGNSKLVLCMTDAFFKIVVVVPIPDKEASSNTQNILDNCLYLFLPPEHIHSDGGMNSSASWLWNFLR